MPGWFWLLMRRRERHKKAMSEAEKEKEWAAWNSSISPDEYGRMIQARIDQYNYEYDAVLEKVFIDIIKIDDVTYPLFIITERVQFDDL